MSRKLPGPSRGRGALSWPDNRYESTTRELILEENEEPSSVTTQILPDTARMIISRNDSPDVGFSQSVNPYRGCEHGCVYCFARPTHAYLGLSPGLDFETKLYYKKNAADLLQKEFSKKGYVPEPIALGINTDSYQPIEEKLRITRSLLEIFDKTSHPLTIVTKSSLIERDLDILKSLSSRSLVHVFLSVTTLDKSLSHLLEPRASAPYRRLETIKALSEAGVPVGVLVAPVIPKLTDHELEKILDAAKASGAKAAGYALLRLPLELKEIFEEWLSRHRPDGEAAILSRLREYHGGQLYRSEFGTRMSGRGIMADLLAKRFQLALRNLEFTSLPPIDCTHFRSPGPRSRSRLFPDFVS